MKFKVLIFSLMITVCVLWGALNSTVFSVDHAERAKYYESCFHNRIRFLALFSCFIER